MQSAAALDIKAVLDVVALLVGMIAIIRFWKSEIASRRAQIAAENDLKWRVSNLEEWRKEHMVDSDARDKLLRNSDLMLKGIQTLMEERRNRPR